MDRLPLAGKIGVAVFALALVVTVVTLFILAVTGGLSESVGMPLFAVFAILGGIGFIADAFKREGAPQALLSVALKFMSTGFVLGFIVGDWGEYWWEGILAGLAVGVVVAVVERVIRTRGGPIRAFRLVAWNLVGVAVGGEGVYVLTKLW